LSKYERTRQGLPKASLISALRLKEFLAFPVLTLRQAQGERTGKVFFDRLRTGRANGLKNRLLTNWTGERIGKTFFDKLRTGQGERVRKVEAILSCERKKVFPTCGKRLIPSPLVYVWGKGWGRGRGSHMSLFESKTP
jgi:hypothetical protein